MSRFAMVLWIAFLAGCSDGRDIRNYYFPVRKLTDGLVYEYENTGTLPGPDYEYWYYLSVDQDTAVYLSATRYNTDLAPDQFVRERLTNDGIVMEELTFLNPDSNTIARPVETTILYGRTFPFAVGEADARPAGYRVSFTAPDNEAELTYVSLERRFRGDTTVNILGEVAGAVVFDLLGEVSLRDSEEGDISPTFSGWEIYAEGLGLVAWERDLGGGNTIGGRLTGRIPMVEFADRVR